MKFRIITAALFSCLLLCSCKSSDSPQANDDAAAAVTDNADEKNGTEKTSVSAQVTTANSNTSTVHDNASMSEGDIDFSDNTETDTNVSPARPTEADETGASLESGNILPDDGLNWTPLTPVS